VGLCLVPHKFNSIGKVTTGNVATEQMRIAENNNITTLGSITAGGAISATTSLTATGTDPSINVVAGANSSLMAVASGNGNYSSNAVIGDTVIRNTSKAIHLQSGTGASAMSIATNNAITIRQPLTISTTTNTAGLTYILECLNPNTTLGSFQGVNIGQSRSDGNCLLLAYRYDAGSDNPNNAAFVGLFGTNKPTLTLQNNNTASFNCPLIAPPRYGARGKTANQTIPASNSAAITWTDITTGILTTNGTTLSNSTGATLILYVSYCITWDPLFGGGVVSGFIQNTTTSEAYLTFSNQLSPTSFVTCAASGVVILPTGQSISCRAINSTLTNLSVLGTGVNVLNSCQMSYYVMN
jgi:hypothetical protein